MADYLDADCFAVCVSPHETSNGSTRPDSTIERHLNFARNLHIETRILKGRNPADAILNFARRNQITQILLSRPKYRPWSHLLSSDPILQIVRRASDIRIIVVADRRRHA
jgi:two-component system sensor histidine kinase KdpD